MYIARRLECETNYLSQERTRGRDTCRLVGFCPRSGFSDCWLLAPDTRVMLTSASRCLRVQVQATEQQQWNTLLSLMLISTIPVLSVCRLFRAVRELWMYLKKPQTRLSRLSAAYVVVRKPFIAARANPNTENMFALKDSPLRLWTWILFRFRSHRWATQPRQAKGSFFRVKLARRSPRFLLISKSRLAQKISKRIKWR